MSRRSRAGQLPLNGDINVVSLIDVRMLLMVIFMITAPMMQGGVDIHLPKAEARPLASHSGMTGTLDKSGQVYVDDAPMTFAEFAGSFKALADRKGKAGVYLRADDGVD